jgi:hypothetical protein
MALPTWTSCERRFGRRYSGMGTDDDNGPDVLPWGFRRVGWLGLYAAVILAIPCAGLVLTLGFILLFAFVLR